MKEVGTGGCIYVYINVESSMSGVDRVIAQNSKCSYTIYRPISIHSNKNAVPIFKKQNTAKENLNSENHPIIVQYIEYATYNISSISVRN